MLERNRKAKTQQPKDEKLMAGIKCASWYHMIVIKGDKTNVIENTDRADFCGSGDLCPVNADGNLAG